VQFERLYAEAVRADSSKERVNAAASRLAHSSRRAGERARGNSPARQRQGVLQGLADPSQPWAPFDPSLLSAESFSKMKRKLRAAAYSIGGVNWDKLFKHLSKTSHGPDGVEIKHGAHKELGLEDFRRALRKEGKLVKNELPDAVIVRIFNSIDSERAGHVSLDAFLKWLATPDSPNRSRSVSPVKVKLPEWDHRPLSPVRHAGAGNGKEGAFDRVFADGKPKPVGTRPTALWRPESFGRERAGR
jgi:hypothetical protein